MTDSHRSARIQALERVLAFEDAPHTTLRERLGEMNIVLEDTNHLADDEDWQRQFPEEVMS